MLAATTAAVAETVTLTPADGVTTNVLQVYSGDTALEIAGPGTVKLNPANAHTGGTTLSGGTLELSGNIPAGSHSPVGAGTFTVSGGTLRGSGTFGGNITGTGDFTIEASNGFVLSGNNAFGGKITIADGTLGIAGGTTAFSQHLYMTGTSAYSQSGGTVTMGANNVQLACGNDATSSFAMTGGTFDANGRNVVVGYGATGASATIDISGVAVFQNAGNVYSYKDGRNSLTLSVHDGGEFSAKRIYGDSSSTAAISVADGGVIGFTNVLASGSTTLSINGGILRNDGAPSGGNNYYKWIQDSANLSVSVGPGGATFKDGGKTTKFAQIYKEMTADVGDGSAPKGVVFDGGNWAYYVAQSYAGPTVIKNGAALFLPNNGTIPSGSAVTIVSGSRLHIGNTDKSVSSLVLEEGAIIGTGSGAKSLSVTGNVTLPSRAKIGFYNAGTPTSDAKNDNGTYAVLNVPVAYAAALRAVHWSCATITEGKSATFSVAESGGTATLSMTIADSDVATTSGDISVGPGEFVSLDGSLNVKSRTVTVDGGYLKIGASLTETSGNGAVYVENGGLLDVYNYVRFSNDANSRYDLYVRNGGIVRALLFSPPSGVTVADLTNVLHLDGGTLQFVAPRKSDYSDNNRQNPYKISVLVGAGGATFDLSHWGDRDRTGWFRFSADNLEFNHDPDCAGADGGITICGSNGDTILYYFKSLGNSTMNGGVTVADGGIISTVNGLTEQTVRIQPGGMFRGYNASNGALIKDLVLGEANATKPVEIVVCKDSTIPTLVVTNALSVLSPVAINVAQRWDYDASLVSGVYTALVYQASCSVNPALFQLPTGSAGTLSASEVTLSGGDYNGWKALVVTIDNDIVVTGATEYPTPLTVSSDRSCNNIVVGGAWKGVADPVSESSLTISGNVTASDALYLGYDPALGASAETGWHKGFLTLNGGSITTPAVYSIYRPGYGSGNSDCRFGCEVTINGGLLDVAGDVCFGYNRSKYGDNLYSRLTVNGGRVAVGGRFYLLYCNTSGAYSAPGSIVLNAGEVDVTGLIDLSRNTQRNNTVSYDELTGIWLNGGVLKAENIMMTAIGAASPRVYFNGGVYAPYGADAANRTMQNLNVCYVSTNGAVISTENIPADATYTIAQPLLTDPALNGAVDGGLTKRGAGTLALTGDNTFTGPLVVEEGTLALSDGAATLSQVSASGVIEGDITVTNALVVGNAGSLLSVDGSVTLSARTAIDFGGALVQGDVWKPVLAASGNIAVPGMIRARNCGDFNRCWTKVEDGVLYVRPTSVGAVISIR